MLFEDEAALMLIEPDILLPDEKRAPPSKIIRQPDSEEGQQELNQCLDDDST